MSEYQYYEFQAIDRPLTQSQMNELRRYSSRAQITPTGFVNVYNWGDFKGDRKKWVEKYFDAFVYVANWGTRQLMFRIPKQLLDSKSTSMYCDDESLSFHIKGDYVVLSFDAEDESGDWEDGEGWMDSLTPLRSDLMHGDHRCLYLGWLASAGQGLLDDDAVEPPVPPGLGELTAALQSLAEFLCIDSDLIAAAAEQSPVRQIFAPTRGEIAEWVSKMPHNEKDALIAAMIEDSNPYFVVEFRQRVVREILSARRSDGDVLPHARRTVGQLVTRAGAITKERRRQEAEAQAREKAKREREQAERRRRHLESLIGKEDALWTTVAAHIATRQPKQYDEAVSLLQDLRDLAGTTGQTQMFAARMDALSAEHARKPSLLARFRKTGLTGEDMV